MKTWLVITLLGMATPAAAGPHWGEFKDNGCVGQLTHPGLRSMSAILWDVPAGNSWEAACASQPATFDGLTIPRPALCVNTSVTEPFTGFFVGTGAIVVGDLCALPFYVPTMLKGNDLYDPEKHAKGALDVCSEIKTWGSNAGTIGQFIMEFKDLQFKEIHKYYDTPRQTTAALASIAPWPYPEGGNPLHGVVPPSSADNWKSTLVQTVGSRPTAQFRQGTGGLNIWGTFLVPDPTCLPPSYVSLENASWQTASDTCSYHGMELCKQEQICQGDTPVPGTPEGDYWLPTSDSDNSWVSIGTAYPDRTCKTHEQVTGSKPAWGTDRGPQSATGNPTLFRCCPN